MFKSNENLLEDFEKILIAYDYYENDRFLNVSDVKNRQLSENLRKINDEII